MRRYGYVRNGVPMVRVVLPSGVEIKGPLLEVLTRVDVLKSIELVTWGRNELRIA